MKNNVLLPCALAVCLLTHCSVAQQPAVGPGGPETATRRAAAISLEDLIGKHPKDNRVFQHYDATGAVRWNEGWPRRVDLTGVAWDSPRTATAITPRHVVMAAHYPRKIGDTLVFHDHSGKRHARTLVKTVSLRAEPTKADITVGLLDHALPDAIKTYPLLKPGTDYADRLAGGPVLVTDQSGNLFVHEILCVREQFLRFTRDPSVDESMRKNLIKGDSGNPSFLVLAGGPVLVETHSSGGSGSGPFYSTANTFAGLEKAVRTLDPSYRIKTRSLDARYSRLATGRRAERTYYLTANTDGSLKKPPKQKASRPAASRPSRPAVPPPTTPSGKKPPRVRRLPPANSP